MAKIELRNGVIQSLSGKLGNTLFKTYRNGQVRAYIMPSGRYQRLSPLSPDEIRNRQLFAFITAEVRRRINAGDTRPRKIIWAEVQSEAER